MCEVINNECWKKRLFMQMNECNAQQFLLLINILDAFFSISFYQMRAYVKRWLLWTTFYVGWKS